MCKYAAKTIHPECPGHGRSWGSKHMGKGGADTPPPRSSPVWSPHQHHARLISPFALLSPLCFCPRGEQRWKAGMGEGCAHDFLRPQGWA